MIQMDEFRGILESLSKSHKHLVSETEWNTIEIELSRGYKTYIKRIEQLGIVGQSRVLDAGSGIGNWSFPLASLNREVIAIDSNSTRLLICNEIRKVLPCNNMTLVHSDFANIPLADETVDAIVCYSALMFADDINAVLQEFNRLLSARGRLFFMVDLWHWYFLDHLREARGSKFSYLFSFIIRKLALGRPIFLAKKRIQYLMRRNGFAIVSQGKDGSTSFCKDSMKQVLTFYPEANRNFSPLYEVCALKLDR